VAPDAEGVVTVKFLDFCSTVHPEFVFDFPHRTMAYELEGVARGEYDAAIAVPPGTGKTQMVMIDFAAWLLHENQRRHIIELANSDSLARLSSGNVLRTLQHPDLPRLEFTKATESQFTIAGGDGRPSLHAAGIMGQVTGQRANFLLVDDPLKNISEAYSETIRERVWQNFLAAAETRLLPNGRIVVIHTRWHLDDLIGRLLARARANKKSRQFRYLCLAAINTDGRSSYIEDTRI
jgi:hypothetical protein